MPPAGEGAGMESGNRGASSPSEVRKEESETAKVKGEVLTMVGNSCLFASQFLIYHRSRDVLFKNVTRI